MNIVVRMIAAGPSLDVKRSAITGVLAATALTLSACSSIGDKIPLVDSESDLSDSGVSDGGNVDINNEVVPDAANAEKFSLIADNLLDAIGQYPKLDSRLTTVQTVSIDNEFEQAVRADLEKRGYKMEADGKRVSARVQPSDNSDSALYVVAVGEISVERMYSETDGQTVPASEMVVRGGEERSIVLNDSDVFGTESERYTAVEFQPYPDLIIDNLLEPRSPPDRLAAQGEVPLIKRNVFETLQSNYASTLDEYVEVDQNILVFPNDSLRLGDTNKRIIEEYVSKMDPDTDILSVIGCSHGHTEISNGNSVLAIGRANRVKEAFLFSGIENDHILDEGCWAPQTFDEVMPQRGVVLTLKRRKES